MEKPSEVVTAALDQSPFLGPKNREPFLAIARILDAIAARLDDLEKQGRT